MSPPSTQRQAFGLDCKGPAIGNYEDAMAHDRLHARGITGVLTLKQLPHLRHPKFVWMSLAPVIDPSAGVIAGVIEPGDRGGL